MPPASGRVRARLLAAGVALSAMATACRVPDLQLGRPRPLAQSSRIYDARGRLITTLHATEDRTVIPFSRIPAVVQDAVVAIEDQRFWSHRGIDLKALVRAVVHDVQAGRVIEGGSTITEQYVKNTMTGGQRTVARKVREALLAHKLERLRSKQAILADYLNTVYFGQGAYGIEAAAKTYFRRPVSQLDLPRAALLAGLIAAPNRWDPLERPRAATDRRLSVLERMRSLDMIDADTFRKAAASPLGLDPRPERRRYAAPYFVEYVKRQILRDPAFGETYTQRYDLLFKGGLRIDTTVDLRIQHAAEEAVRGVLSEGSDPYGALTAIDPRTGAIKAMVGGRDFFAPPRRDPTAKVNLATGGITGRQAGSAFKPFALVAAIESGIPMSRVYTAGPSITIPQPSGPPWYVRNYEGSAYGSISVEQATIHSVNVVYAQLIMDIGPAAVAEAARRMGIRRRIRPYPSAVLGANEVDTLEMASAYGTLAAGGWHAPPIAIRRITGPDGTVLFQPDARPQQVVSPIVAWSATQILRKVILYGTGQGANIGRPAAGKTGTAQQWRDAWFAGFIPQLTAAVWVGFPQAQIPMVPPRTRIRVTGGSFPAEIWHAFMTTVTRHMPVQDFDRPQGRYITVAIDITRGCLADATTPPDHVREVPFLEGTQPKRLCDATGSLFSSQTGVPAVIGMSIDRAVEVLRRAGFPATRVDEYDPRYPPGTVLRQDPGGGARVAPGTVVTLTVATEGSPTARVPDVVGLTKEEARQKLREAGYSVAIFYADEYDPDVDPDVVVSQDPEPGTRRKPGSTVRIEINPEG